VATETSSEASFFLYLAHCGNDRGLPGIELALRERPILVFRPVNERDLRLVGIVGRFSPQHRTGGEDVGSDGFVT
jgi:hypothetical protein